MKCPYCGKSNIGGVDECEFCQQNLAAIDTTQARSKIGRSLMSDSVTRLSPRKPVCFGEEKGILEAIRLMKEQNIGSLLVTQGETPVGILTERDILFKVLGKNADLKRIKVGEVMTAHLEALSPDDTLAFAINKMSVGGFRHLPILQAGKPVGILSVRDILGYFSRFFSRAPENT